MTTIKFVDAKTAKDWLSNNEAIIVDVREPAEYAATHIPEATLLPLGVLEKNTLPDLGDKKLIIHCQFGKRGGMACEKLLQENPDLDIYNLEGGLAAWQLAGFKVEKSE